LPPRLASHELVAAAWQGLDAAQVWDTHVHLLGTGDSASGVYLNPRMASLLYPQLGREGPDALEALALAKRHGARALKWLPAAMGIDPASPRCARFYDALRAHDLPLITHAGAEHAVAGHDWDDYGNPLRLRSALDAGVRVVIAHCAAIGEDRDLDRGEHGPYVPSFALFERLMNEPRYEKNLYGDISAMTQLNRAGPALARVLQEERWHARLLNGSDYPLPGVMPIFSVDYLASLKLIAPAAAPVLRDIRLHNPLLFDFVLKRVLRSNGKRFGRRVFQTRSFFEARV
jgi:uncharacterized protein